jgi:hypothetical protein
MEQRPYQDEAIRQLEANFQQGIQRQILCATTGSGKTVMFTRLAAQYVNAQNQSRTRSRIRLPGIIGAIMATFWECLKCGWKGEEAQLIRVDTYPDDDVPIPVKMEGCPVCESVCVEPSPEEKPKYDKQRIAGV